jgi:hypothetical protein
MEHVIVHKNGSKFFKKDDKYHRNEKDEFGELLPAIEFANGHGLMVNRFVLFYPKKNGFGIVWR